MATDGQMTVNREARFLEWIAADVPTITRTMGEGVDILLDMVTRRVVGVRLWLRTEK